ncbi:TonB family C-terminal domain protein [Leptospira fainei serovar Hurstbridge str. BUT 6]|uniref:TonB family C-terminal domain protein n=1 Tax=Leptospira fainei serovar Hurstbridge str. BUT 6 TaxID=1193011 RepID=S3UWD9_9LEPT|nr:TonB family C-terminal domain protein [Leptospira fainei serovar Hurstbridge str. BUT 6]
MFSRKRRIVEWGINFLSWISPFVGFGIFFPLGVLFAFPTGRNVRRNAFSSLALQIAILGILYPLEITQLFSTKAEEFISIFVLVSPQISGLHGWFILPLFFLLGLVFMLLQAKSVRSKLRSGERKPLILVPVFSILALFGVLILTHHLAFEDEFRVKMAPFVVLSESVWIFFPWLIAVAGMMSGGRPIFLFRKPWAWFSKQVFVSRVSETKETQSALKKRKYSMIRDLLLPGWGHIYSGNLWKGFPILFVYLLLLLFFATFFFSWMEPAFGIRYLASLGLKPGIPDKKFFEVASSFLPWFFALLLLSATNGFSHWLLKRSFQTNLPARGLRPGFANNIALSVLIHLVLLSLVLIIPAMINRKSDKEKSKPEGHYTPENTMEYYFIDPNVPDEVQGLNGGVITGTETPNTQQGEKIPNEKPADEGRVKGDVKRIRGKKLPPTYSNYISAKMRAFESFMEYWKTAPHNYSCVVAYTITPEGDVVDVELVESSPYPEQDRRTLELIENLSPMMPPPGTKGYVRVTELFWNGTINPETMPTKLQSDLVQMFDGRYMEEL